MASKVISNVRFGLNRWTRMSVALSQLSSDQASRYVCKETERCAPGISVVSVIFFSQNVSPKSPNETKRIKSNTYIKINLLDPDGKLTVTSLEEAEKLAKRRDLKLVKIVNNENKVQRSVYKMMTAAQYFDEDLKLRKVKAEKKKSEIKAEKLLSISDKINKHDLESKLKMMRKWLEKRHEVRIVITESEDSLSVLVYNAIEASAKDMGKIVQKRQKGKEIKFSILPTIKDIKVEETSDSV